MVFDCLPKHPSEYRRRSVPARGRGPVPYRPSRTGYTVGDVLAADGVLFVAFSPRPLGPGNGFARPGKAAPDSKETDVIKEGLASRIREFWFADTLSDLSRVPARMGFWFGADAAKDDAIRREWAQAVEDARAGRLDPMGKTAPGRSSLILLLDQFARNIYRGTPQAFEKDGRARYLMRDGMSRLMDLELSPIERCFFYMPLQHSEFLDDQEASVARYSQLATEVSADHRDIFENFLYHAQQHRDVVARFGRFPHRNAILNRLSTREERAYLAARPPTLGHGQVAR